MEIAKTLLRKEWSLITERGATIVQNGEGASEVLLLQKKRGPGAVLASLR